MYSNATGGVYPMQCALTDDVAHQLPSEQIGVQQSEWWMENPRRANEQNIIQTS